MASFGRLPAGFGGAIGIADGAGGGDSLGDPGVGSWLPPALFRGRHIRHEAEFTFAVDQDRVPTPDGAR